jgi:hypothetical protein
MGEKKSDDSGRETTGTLERREFLKKVARRSLAGVAAIGAAKVLSYKSPTVRSFFGGEAHAYANGTAD